MTSLKFSFCAMVRYSLDSAAGSSIESSCSNLFRVDLSLARADFAGSGICESRTDAALFNRRDLLLDSTYGDLVAS